MNMISHNVSLEPRLALFAAAVRAARQQRGWTQAELAQRVGIGLGTVIKIESNAAGVAYGTVLQLCSILDLSPDPDQLASNSAQQRNLEALASQRKRVRKPAVDRDLDV